MEIRKEIRDGKEVIIFPFKEFSEALISMKLFRDLLRTQIRELQDPIEKKLNVLEVDVDKVKKSELN